jgi:MFS family permease
MSGASGAASRGDWRPIPAIVAAGCLISAVGFGPRSTMGFFLTPMTTELGWARGVFALAIAIQNLVWGLAQPLAGMIADKFGTARVLVAGALAYSLGLALMSQTTDPLALQLTAGLLVGLGIAGGGFLLVLAAFARLLPERMRTLAYGIGTAAGSVGQFVFAPLSQGLIAGYGWRTTLLIIAAIVLVVPALAVFLRGRPEVAATARGQREQSIAEALREAFRHRSYQLLVSGFFVCGFQLAFITVHLPPYLADIGIPPRFGGYALALIGGFNIIGSISSGVLSGRMPRRFLLSTLYLARSGLIVFLVATPPSAPTVLVFSAAMGLLWLSTVPPTQQLVAIMFGTRYMATLFGFVFFSHQLGSFLGVWLGGVLYDATGSYNTVWWLSAALGVFAALVHLPIREAHVTRLAAA